MDESEHMSALQCHRLHASESDAASMQNVNLSLPRCLVDRPTHGVAVTIAHTVSHLAPVGLDRQETRLSASGQTSIANKTALR